MYISKIVSGGQTGVDRGALEAALKAQFPYGGMIPKGRLAEDGSVPEKFTCMDVADSEDYRFRTRWNVEHSDATLILTFGEELEGGTQRTRQYCMNARKPFFIDNPSSPTKDGGRIAVFKWLEDIYRRNDRKTPILNVAGPRESKSPGIADAVEKYVSRLIAAQRRAEEALRQLDLVELYVRFRAPFVVELSHKGVDAVGRIPAWLPKIDVMSVERVSLCELLIHCVPRARILDVKESIKSGVVDELGWPEEPSHVVSIGFVEQK